MKTEDSLVPFEEALNRTGNGLYNYLLVSTCALLLLAIGMDLFGFSLVVAAACELRLTVAEKGILTSLPFIGILLVSYAWGYISDTKGRRLTLVLSMQMAFVLSCLASLSPNWVLLAVLKFFAVCFSCAANSTTYTLVGESCIQKVRSKYMVMMTCCIVLSPAVAGVFAYPTLKLDIAPTIPLLDIHFRPWRLLLIILVLPTGIGAIAMYFFHESPKFLANCGKKEEALMVLKSIHRVNKVKEEFNIGSIVLEDEIAKKKMSLMRSIYEQCAPLFRQPYILRTLQLFYIVGVVYVTNNSFLMWLPHILNEVKESLQSNATTPGNICKLISVMDHTTQIDTSNATVIEAPDRAICIGGVEDNVVFTLIGSQSLFTVFNFGISYFPNRRKAILIAILCITGTSGVLINLMPEPVSSVVFLVIFPATCLTMGILASYFVDFYPTSYRGMVQCLSIMVGRSTSFLGINLVGLVLFDYCQLTFYLWSLLVFSSVVAAYFLPPDKTKIECII